MVIFVGFGTKANKLSVTLVEPRVMKLMNAPTRISVIVVVKRVILSVIVLIPGALGSLMFKILLQRALPIASTPVLGLIEMLIMITLLRAPRFLSLIQGLFLLLLMDWVLGMLIKIFLPRVSRSASEAELDPGSCPSGDVHQDLPAQGASVAEPESDPGSSCVSTGISVCDDSPELVIKEFCSSS